MNILPQKKMHLSTAKMLIMFVYKPKLAKIAHYNRKAIHLKCSNRVKQFPVQLNDNFVGSVFAMNFIFFIIQILNIININETLIKILHSFLNRSTISL